MTAAFRKMHMLECIQMYEVSTWLVFTDKDLQREHDMQQR